MSDLTIYKSAVVSTKARIKSDIKVLQSRIDELQRTMAAIEQDVSEHEWGCALQKSLYELQKMLEQPVVPGKIRSTLDVYNMVGSAMNHWDNNLEEK